MEPGAIVSPAQPPTALPAPSAVPGPANASVPSLPPLPASVNLNPAVTRVTVVPLATSLAAIPPVGEDEVKEIKEWMEVDRKYEGVYREMKGRMNAEHRELMGPRHVPWWEKGTLDMNASRSLQGREKFEVRYPYRKRDRDSRRKPPKREGIKLPRALDPDDANRPEELVPIRLEFDVDHHKVRDTFIWNMNACVVGPEHFAQTVVEDYNLSPSYHAVIVKAIQDQLSDYRAHSPNYDGDSWNVVRTNDTLRRGSLEGESAQWWCNWRKRLRTEYAFVRAERNKRRKLRKAEPENERPMTVEEFSVNSKTLHEDMRILIRLDIVVGSIKLDDQFEWDLDSDDASPEDFAENYARELGLGGEFKTAIIHSIREQVHAYQKCLYLVGHTMDGTPVEDDDLRNSFLPSLSTGARAMDQVQSFTPLLNYLSDGELERHEKERDKEFNKRRKKGRGGRRGVALPDREPIRTCRTPAIGFPEPDPATVAAAAAANAPMSRRAAAAAASVTIANLVASENAPEPGDSPHQPIYRTSSLPSLPLPPPPVFKEKTTKGFFKPPTYDTSILRPRAKVPAPIPSTAADISKLPAPLENDPPPPPSVAAVLPDSRAPRAVTAKRAKELERSAKEKEFAEGQQQNMIDGVWHCSNCGCPESIAIGRRKGPLGDKSQCGTCGKYWHRYRKPRPVDYNPDYEFHANGAKKDAEVAKRKKGRPPSSATAAPTPADTSEPQTPRDSGEGPSRASPLRDVSPVSTASTASEMPLAQRIKINHTPSTPSAPASAPISAAAPAQSPVVVPSVSPSSSVSPPAPASAAVAPPSPSSAPPSASSAPSSALPVPTPPTPAPPAWLSNAMQDLQARYKDDRFEILPKASAVEWEWRLKCLDCPGKLYMTGVGETLNNYELHLKNRLHRRRVNDRIRNSAVS
ncbi:SNF5-domain-containing protein [Mycena sanguinolenta]|nr:SNF5-domain-containing protein [Mycena sanguinolenta]